MNRHSDQTQQRFIELRAQGWTLDRIGRELPAAKGTLIAWQKKFQAQIDALQRLEQEALQARLLPSQELELTRLATRLDQVETVLAKRKLECLSTEFLFCLAGSLRAQIRKQILRPSPVEPGFQPGGSPGPTPDPHSASSNPPSETVAPSTLDPRPSTSP